ncbi:hypothetical protein SSTU70S_01164 [Stutzerimonas stutzeri]
MKRWSFSNLILVLGLLFIYLPMVILVIYSFNNSRLVTVWGGWSVKWYLGLLDNSQLMGSVMRSLEVAFYTAIAAVALGTMAAFVLTRIPVFRGRTLFGGLVTAPLVMPEVITGLSLLLLFVAMAQLIGWPAQRGLVTIWIAHTTFCSSYVAVVVMARLRELDLSIEEAAMDLGARPWKVFFLITMPMIAPSLAAGGMLSFALSLDDLVLASFVSGPGSTTLPMEILLRRAPGREAGNQRRGQSDSAQRVAGDVLRLVPEPSRREASAARHAAGDGRERCVAATGGQQSGAGATLGPQLIYEQGRPAAPLFVSRAQRCQSQKHATASEWVARTVRPASTASTIGSTKLLSELHQHAALAVGADISSPLRSQMPTAGLAGSSAAPSRLASGFSAASDGGSRPLLPGLRTS